MADASSMQARPAQVAPPRARRIHISIATKLIAVTLVIFFASIFPLAYKTSDLFREFFGKREEDANRSQAEARATEIELVLRSVQTRAAAIAATVLRARDRSGGDLGSAAFTDRLDDLRFIFERERDLAALKVVERRDGATKTIAAFVNPRFLKEYGVTPELLGELDRQVPPPLTAAFEGNLATKNRSIPGKAGLFSMAEPIAKDNDRVTDVALVDVDVADIQKTFAIAGERVVYLVNRDGEVIAHPNDDLVKRRVSLAKRPSVKRAFTSAMAQGQLRFFDRASKGFVVAAFSRTSYGLAVISEATESVILEPARIVLIRSLRVAGTVVSVAFLVIFLFSTTLTQPIDKLVQMTKSIARGNFDINPRAHIRSSDEVGTLAEAFGTMLHGLREREKVKALFNKFHGSSVTESLLSADQVAIGGTKRSVAVLFSDIRGFTSFSETRKPEEVVAMLNEYFGHMVHVIQENHGVVDKFIGDAIMAIWGAPRSTGEDHIYAVKAALEMRLALERLNETRKSRGEEPLMIGIGLHIGEAIAGTIGSENRMEYTVIGNTVNTTSRIEAATKAFGADILLSEEIATLVKGQFLVEMAGKSEVKGRSEPLALFRLNGYVDAQGTEVLVRTPYSAFEREAADKVKVVS